MKTINTLLVISLMALTSVCQAQIKEGTVMLGGSITHLNNKVKHTSTPDEYNVRTFYIGPSIGYAIADNLVAGIELGYVSGREKNNNLTKRNGITGELFLRKYWNISSRFYAFAHADAGYSRSRYNYYTEDESVKYGRGKGWHAAASVTPGIAYSIGKKVQLESTFLPLLNLQYSSSNTQYYNPGGVNDNSRLSEFQATSTLENAQTLSLGIKFFL